MLYYKQFQSRFDFVFALSAPLALLAKTCNECMDLFFGITPRQDISNFDNIPQKKEGNLKNLYDPKA